MTFPALYSAFNLEEPLLCFVVNKYVLCSERVTIVAIGLKFAMSVHTSFCSVCRKSGLIMLVDSKVVAACVPGIGLQNFMKKYVKARKIVWS